MSSAQPWTLKPTHKAWLVGVKNGLECAAGWKRTNIFLCYSILLRPTASNWVWNITARLFIAMPGSSHPVYFSQDFLRNMQYGFISGICCNVLHNVINGINYKPADELNNAIITVSWIVVLRELSLVWKKIAAFLNFHTLLIPSQFSVTYWSNNTRRGVNIPDSTCLHTLKLYSQQPPPCHY